MKLNLGCGLDIKPGYVNLDNAKLKGIDIVHDLNAFPYPFKANAFDEIYARHVLEHLHDLIKVMDEICRISKPGAKLHIIAPYFSNPGSFSDPTHKHFFTYNTFDYFTKQGAFSYYTKYHVHILSRHINFITSKNIAIRFFSFIPQFFMNLFPLIYQRFFAYIFPAAEIEYILKVVK